MPAFRHLLVPLDGSHLAEVVLPTALGFAAGIGARVTLLHVLERAAPETVHGESHLRHAQNAAHYLRDVAQRNTTCGAPLDLHVHENQENDVARSIVEHARELGADLIALTPHGRGGVRRWLIGSIAQQVLQRGETPVLVVPSTAPAPASGFEINSLLVPLDGEAATEAVLPLAADIARTWHASIRLLQVVPTLTTLTGDRAAAALLAPIATSSALQIEQGAAEDYLQTLAGSWPADVPLVIEVLRGDASQVIVDAIRRNQPDLIVLSTHGRVGLAGLWAASVAPKIITHVTRPVLMVRAARVPAG